MASWYDDDDVVAGAALDGAVAAGAAGVVAEKGADGAGLDEAGAAAAFGLSPVKPEKPANGFAFGAAAAVRPWKPLNGLAPAVFGALVVVAGASGLLARRTPPTRAFTILRWRIASSDARWKPMSNASLATPPPRKSSSSAAS